MRRLIPPSAAVILCLLLTGCFTSELPKFPLSSAVAAFGNGGRYGVFEHVGNGKYIKRRTVMVTPSLDGSYAFVGEKSTLLISFHNVGNNVIVGQSKPGNNRNAYIYLILARKGKETFLYLPQCEAQDTALLSAHGITFRDPFECSIDGVSNPARLFATLSAGEPNSKMVPE